MTTTVEAQVRTAPGPGSGEKNSRIPLKHLSAVAMRSPDVFWNLVRAEATKHIFAPRDRKRLEGQSRHLKQVSLKIVNSCNLRCKTCGQWGETDFVEAWRWFKQAESLGNAAAAKELERLHCVMTDDERRQILRPTG